jgi:hypothetical protein
MRPRALLTTLALGRLAIGAGLTAKPDGPLGAGWVGAAESSRPTSAMLFRAVGARDMALALGTLAALRQGSRLRPWLLAATLADVADLLATFAAGRAVPLQGKATIVAFAGGAIAGQLSLVQALD